MKTRLLKKLRREAYYSVRVVPLEYGWCKIQLALGDGFWTDSTEGVLEENMPKLKELLKEKRKWMFERLAKEYLFDKRVDRLLKM